MTSAYLRRFSAAAICIIVLLARSEPAQAQSGNSEMEEMRSSLLQMKAEMRQMRQDLAQAHTEIKQLRDSVTALRASQQSAEPKASSEASGYASAADVNQQSTESAADEQASQGNDLNLLRARVEEQQQTKVESASKYRVKLSGLILMNAFSTRGRVDYPDLPNRAFDSTNAGSFGATMRQSILGLQVIGPTIANGRTSANVSVDFFGGFPQTQFGSTNGLLRLREAYGRIDWDNDSLTFGQQGLIFSPLSPTSLATVAQPAFSWAGNLWVWTPQAALEHHFHTSESSFMSVQAAVMDPMTEEIPRASQFYIPNQGEASKLPAFAATVNWNTKLAGESMQVGLGGYTSHLDYGFSRDFQTWAVTAFWKLPVTKKFQFSGEAYRGMGVGGLGGGIWQSAIYNGDPALSSTTVRPLNAVGGWAQLKYQATPKLEFNAAVGDDNVLAYDLRFAPQIMSEYSVPMARNRAAFGNAIYHPRSNLVFSLEYRKLWTYRYTGARNSADQINVGAGVSF